LQKQSLYETALKQECQLAVFFMFIDKTVPEYNRVFEKMNTAISKLQQVITEKDT
jgi:hypothetical protein